MWHYSVCNTVQEPTVTSIIDVKKTTAWGESGFPSEFLAPLAAQCVPPSGATSESGQRQVTIRSLLVVCVLFSLAVNPASGRGLSVEEYAEECGEWWDADAPPWSPSKTSRMLWLIGRTSTRRTN